MFSSGCIRLEKPFELAAYLLRDSPQWTPERIATVVKGKATKTVRLSEPMPIYLVYVTAWVDDSGIAQFRDDIYSRDKRMQEALKASRSPRGDAPGAVYNHMAARSPL
jgi:murein L,D-transpeptidase YcbB/YkuD